MTVTDTAGGYVGRSVPRLEDARFLRGEATYVDDVTLTGTLYLAFARSVHAHARLGAVSVERARALRGVYAVLTAADIAGRVQAVPQREFPGATVAAVPHPVLAEDRVRYVGEPIAAVVAESRAQAEDAAELVGVEYEPLDAVLDPRTAGNAQPRLHADLPDNVLMRLTADDGDVSGLFARAAHIVSGSFHIPRVVASPMEPRGALASYDRVADLLTVWCSTQDPHRPLRELAHILRRPVERIRVIVPDVGGAFGSKGGAAIEAAVAAVAAMELGRPVRWTEDRSENFLAAHQGRGLDADVDLALDGAGRMLALRARLFLDMGAYLFASTPVPGQTAVSLLTGVYRIEAADVRLDGVATNKVPTGPYRGAGRPESALIIERMVDLAATELVIDPVELRRRNLIPAGAFPYATPLGLTYDSGNYPGALDRLLAKADLPALRARQRRARAEGRLIGIGVAAYVERAGGGSEGADVAVDPSGRIVVWTGSSPHGQGHETTFAQLVADELGVGLEDVAIRWGDSGSVPAGTGTFGSRSMTMGGTALLMAVERIKQQARALGSRMLGVAEECLVWKGDRLQVAGEERGLTLGELAVAANDPAWVPEGCALGLRRVESFDAPFVFSAGAYLASVEIERASGRARVEKVVAVDDVGRVVNPLLAEGQVVGGCAQGLGQALVEEFVHDESGQPSTSSYVDYGLLTAADMPAVETEFVQTLSPHNPLGMKGVGEGGAIGAPAAVANAVADALAPLGVRHVDLPFTEEKLWQLVAGAETVAPAESVTTKTGPDKARALPMWVPAALAAAGAVTAVAVLAGRRIAHARTRAGR